VTVESGAPGPFAGGAAVGAGGGGSCGAVSTWATSRLEMVFELVGGRISTLGDFAMGRTWPKAGVNAARDSATRQKGRSTRFM